MSDSEERAEETDSDSFHTAEESSEEPEGVDEWPVGSEEEGEDQDLSHLRSSSTCVKAFTVKHQSSQILKTGSKESESQVSKAGELCPVPSSDLVPSSGLDVENITEEFQTGQVIQYSVNQTYNLQQFGDVTFEARNVNVGGTQNIATKSGPSQEQEEKPLTTTQKIRRRTESRIKSWTKDMVKTEGLKKVLDKIHSGASWVTIKGSPGEGKTTVAYMALKELSTEGKQVFHLITPEEFSEVIITYSKPVIMLDDIFGDLEFDEIEWLRWKLALRQVLDVREHRSDEALTFQNPGTTVILVGRDYVLNAASNHMGRLSQFVIHQGHVVDMSHLVERELQEKLDIWNARVKTMGIELEERVLLKICKTKSQHGFPHVCRLFVAMYQNNKKLSAEDFFKSPLEFLNNTVVKFMKDTKS